VNVEAPLNGVANIFQTSYNLQIIFKLFGQRPKKVHERLFLHDKWPFFEGKHTKFLLVASSSDFSFKVPQAFF
jgi:hypothetical protein